MCYAAAEKELILAYICQLLDIKRVWPLVILPKIANLHLTWQKVFYYQIQGVREMSVNTISREPLRNLTHI